MKIASTWSATTALAAVLCYALAGLSAASAGADVSTMTNWTVAAKTGGKARRASLLSPLSLIRTRPFLMG